ncbi:MAG: signal peptidase I [Candidatus Gallimonas sp.]
MTKPPEMLNQKKKKSAWAIVCSAVCGVLAVLLVLFLLFDVFLNATCFVVEVSGSSMEQTLRDGDRVYALKNARAKRGDIVIIDVSEHRDVFLSGDLLIKRLIAVEGDSVYCEDGVVYIRYAGETEFVSLTENYVCGETREFGPVTVGEGEIFFLGDNRTVSHDSSAEGCFSQTEIVGVVPEWAVSIKGFSTAWEGFRGSFAGA